LVGHGSKLCDIFCKYFALVLSVNDEIQLSPDMIEISEGMVRGHSNVVRDFAQIVFIQGKTPLSLECLMFFLKSGVLVIDELWFFHVKIQIDMKLMLFLLRLMLLK
jgi:hypothetical protein